MCVLIELDFNLQRTQIIDCTGDSLQGIVICFGYIFLKSAQAVMSRSFIFLARDRLQFRPGQRAF